MSWRVKWDLENEGSQNICLLAFPCSHSEDLLSLQRRQQGSSVFLCALSDYESLKHSYWEWSLRFWDLPTLFLTWNYCSRIIQIAQKDSAAFTEKGTFLPRGFLFLSILRATPYLRLSKLKTNKIHFKNSQAKRVLLRVLSKSVIFQRPENLSSLAMTQELEAKWEEEEEEEKKEWRREEKPRQRH